MRRVRKIRKTVDLHLPKDKSNNNPSRIQRGDIKQPVTKKITLPAQVKGGKKMGMPKHPQITYDKVEPIWNGETVYIIGGGPSLKNFEWNKLKGKKTIAINRAIEFYPNADAMYWTDGRVWGWYQNEIKNYKGLKFTLRGKNYDTDVKVLKRGRKFGLETARDTLAHGNNSGYAAINLAIHLGAKRIILLGYDMGNNGKSSHFHDGYPVNSTSEKIYKDQFLPGFDFLKDAIKGMGIQIFNACPTSKLNTFKKITIEESLSFR